MKCAAVLMLLAIALLFAAGCKPGMTSEWPVHVQVDGVPQIDCGTTHVQLDPEQLKQIIAAIRGTRCEARP